MRVVQEKFAELDGQTITAYTLINDHGMEVTSIDYGCIITRMMIPDRDGTIENVVLGFDTLEEYLQHSPYFGAVVGRHAGRIKNGEFELDGKLYRLAKNDRGNHLHGGLRGFDKVIWDSEVKENADSVSLIFRYLSKDQEEGYPGNLKMKVTYTLNNDNEFTIIYVGVSDQKTVLNLTNHSYFNLSGNMKRNILDHVLTLKSDYFVELDEQLIPTGEFRLVENSVFDFRTGRKIRDGVVSKDRQNIIAGNGYDHPFLLTKNHHPQIILEDKESGRSLTIETDQPSVVLYTANQLSGEFKIRGINSQPYLGLCLETQGLPDAIHHSTFPSTILEKDEVYRSVTKYKFSISVKS
ncbi:aldose epimerase family protein [Tepidibacillus fermentans]|uniref:Aldose 1-epimerase n=1 Tax=Tepidibacillus fermentans TaxID=1281767 RepID=A0A4R3K520_9BACI|nr:aldose epimerase family protein [Tepidibacillus fermentans]TCS77761.1 aldose 1-epimerase [Tepidibacillus fermentans]